MKEIDNLIGTHIVDACKRLAQEAPAFMVFNGVRVESKPGDSAGDLHARWQEAFERQCEEERAKRAAYDKTPEGQVKIAAAKARAEEEERRRQETLAAIASSGVRERFPWTGMGEISGFGGAYEEACRNMVYAGIVWLEKHPGADLKAHSYRNVYGILTADSDDAKALEKAVVSVCPDCSGAMHHATMAACLYIAANGWEKYREAKLESEKERGA